jgi:hypothetical protein
MMPNWRYGLLALLLAGSGVLSASQATAATEWATVAEVLSKTIVTDASVNLGVDIAKPDSTRVRLRSPGHTQNVDVNFSVFCVKTSFESGSRSGEFSMALTGDRTWAVHSIPKPRGNWAECSVSVFSFSKHTGRLEVQVQAILRP